MSFGWTKYTKKMMFIGIMLASLAAGGSLIGFNLSHPSSVTRSRTAPAQPNSVPAIPTTLVAALVVKTSAFLFPGGPAAVPIAASWHGSPLHLPIIASDHGYLEVRLPSRPNGSTTWIRQNAVHLYATTYRIRIDLRTQHLLLYHANKLILDAPAGIGTVADPTPTGHFFVAFFAKAPSPAWGPFVLVTSAHSNTISDWEESGDAMVAIHGPLGADAKIGSTGARVSHGCVRLHDADLALLREVPDGSPIDIVG